MVQNAQGSQDQVIVNAAFSEGLTLQSFQLFNWNADSSSTPLCTVTTYTGTNGASSLEWVYAISTR